MELAPSTSSALTPFVIGPLDLGGWVVISFSGRGPRDGFR